MDFSGFIRDHDSAQAVKGQQNTALPPHLTDPFLRRYHIQKILIESGKLTVAVWAVRLVAQNASRISLRRLSPWLQLGVGSLFAAWRLREKFYSQAHRDQITRKNLTAAYNRQHYRDSQYWH